MGAREKVDYLLGTWCWCMLHAAGGTRNGTVRFGEMGKLKGERERLTCKFVTWSTESQSESESESEMRVR